MPKNHGKVSHFIHVLRALLPGILRAFRTRHRRRQQRAALAARTARDARPIFVSSATTSAISTPNTKKPPGGTMNSVMGWNVKGQMQRLEQHIHYGAR